MKINSLVRQWASVGRWCFDVRPPVGIDYNNKAGGRDKVKRSIFRSFRKDRPQDAARIGADDSHFPPPTPPTLHQKRTIMMTDAAQHMTNDRAPLLLASGPAAQQRSRRHIKALAGHLADSHHRVSHYSGSGGEIGPAPPTRTSRVRSRMHFQIMPE